LQAALVWAEKNGGDLKRVGVTGFCWGGRITWLAATLPQVRAGVAWYGRLEGTHSSTTPTHPIDNVHQIKARMLGLYGGADASISADSVSRMKNQLLELSSRGNKAALQSELVIYPDAGHAFHADYRSSYRATEAKDGWQKTLAWLK